MSERIIFWQNAPSIQQAPLIREVARLWSGEVLVVAEKGVSESRLAQGWYLPDFEPARLVVHPDRRERERIWRMGEGNNIHIFSGFHAYPETYWTMKAVSRGADVIGVYVEPGWDDGSIRAVLRRLRYAIHARRWSRRIAFLLATGETGVRWFQERGFRAERIIPFGYFVECMSEETALEKGEIEGKAYEGWFRLIYVGQLVKRKGVDILLRALSRMRERQWLLEIVGAGEEGARLRGLTEELDLDTRVRWLGVIPNREIRKRLASADLLILPSRHDGWGVVVNEALGAGTRVVVSSACGASDIVVSPYQGAVFAAGSDTELENALRAAMERGNLSSRERRGLRAWARESIGPAVAARYLLDVIEYAKGGRDKPIPPWRRGGIGLGSGEFSIGPQPSGCW